MPKLGAAFPTNAKSRAKKYEDSYGGRKYKSGEALDTRNDNLPATEKGKVQWYHPTKGLRERRVESLRASAMSARMQNGELFSFAQVRRYIEKGY